MITVNVTTVGALLSPEATSEFQIECPAGTTLRELLRTLLYDEEHLPHILTAVNGEIERHDYALADGDAVLLSTPMGGG